MNYERRNPFLRIITVALITTLIVLSLLNGLVFFEIINSSYVVAGLSLFVLGVVWFSFFSSSQSFTLIKDGVEHVFNGEPFQYLLKKTRSKSVAKIILALEQISLRVTEVGQAIKILGKQESLDLQHLSTEDKIGKSLVEVNETMLQLNRVESKRKWKIEGVAKFAEYLREDSQDLHQYCFKIINELVRYCNCNQGGLYVKYEDEDEETEFLELKASYAYERKKHDEKRIEKGQGLLGQCMREMSTIYLTDIPQDYVNITSGMGEAVPSNIVIVPLIFNDEFQGAIELASFHILEAYQVSFLEELAQSIASSLSNIKTAEKTRQLLEDSRNITTELQSNEEEMRQNLEELSAIQEEMQRNQAQLNGLFNAIDTTLAMVEFDPKGQIIKANDIGLNILALNSADLESMSFEKLLGQNNDSGSIWTKLINKQTVSGEYQISNKKGDIWIESTFTPILNTQQEFEKVLMLSKEITVEKELELENERREVELNSHMDAINKTIASCEYNMEGHLVGANDIFLGITGFQLEDILGKHHFDLIPKSDRDKPQTELMWGGIKEGKFFSGEFKLMDKQGKELWLTGTYNPILNTDGDPYKVMMFAQFTTAEKEKKADLSGTVGALKNTLPVIEVKSDRVFKSANKLFFEEFGYNRTDLRGKTFEEIVGDPSPAHIIELFKNIEENEFVEELITFYYPDKTKKKFRTTFTPIFDLERELSKIVVVMVDMEMVTAMRNN